MSIYHINNPTILPRIHLEDTVLKPPVFCTVGTADRVQIYTEWLYSQFSNDLDTMRTLATIHYVATQHQRLCIYAQTPIARQIAPAVVEFLESHIQPLEQLGQLFDLSYTDPTPLQ